MIVLGSRGGAHEQIVPEIYPRVFEVLMRYRYPNRVSNWSSWCQKWRGLGLDSSPPRHCLDMPRHVEFVAWTNNFYFPNTTCLNRWYEIYYSGYWTGFCCPTKRLVCTGYSLGEWFWLFRLGLGTGDVESTRSSRRGFGPPSHFIGSDTYKH